MQRIDHISKIPWVHETTEGGIDYNTVRASFTLHKLCREFDNIMLPIMIWQFDNTFDIYVARDEENTVRAYKSMDALDMLSFLQREEVFYDDAP